MNRLYARPKVRIKRPDTEKHLRALVFRSRIITDCLQSKRIATKVTFKRGFLSVQAQSFDNIILSFVVSQSSARKSGGAIAIVLTTIRAVSMSRFIGILNPCTFSCALFAGDVLR